MREIKFRVFAGKKMQYIQPRDFAWLGENAIGKHPVMQYTGLLDKNGKEIYEGDLITNVWGDFESVFEVKWDLYGFRLQSVTDRFEMSKGEWRDCPTHIDLTEIIGNIYENPDLLVGDYQS